MGSDRNPASLWNSETYHRISGPQTSWGKKVLARMPAPAGDEAILDVGCGSGRLTAELLNLVPRGRVVALDRSGSMIATARAQLGPRFGDRVEFREQDILELTDEHVFDLVFSTATLHWVLDHPRLFAVLYRALKPNGRLVAQCGGAGNLARIYGRSEALMREPPFEPFFRGWEKPLEFSSDETASERLIAAGFVDVETDLEPEPTRFANAEAFREFITNVLFVAHLPRLPTPELQAAFIDHLVVLAGEDDPPFELDYVRLNISARRP